MIVAAFNVVSTLMMMIHDKSKEIAILKAMGLRPSQSFRLFCLVGVGMGLVGTFFGVAAGPGRELGISNDPSDPSSGRYLLHRLSAGRGPRWREVGLIGGVALLISFVATLFPAWQVSRGSPLEGHSL